MRARIIEVIETETIIGDGTPDDPTRVVYELWSRDGVLIMARDSWQRADLQPADESPTMSVHDAK